MESFAQKYEIVQKIGNGAFGIAYKARNRVTRQLYCAKVIDIKHSQSKDKLNALKQIQILKKMDFQYVVKYIDSFETKKDLTIIVMDSDGDLKQHIKKRREEGNHFTETIILNWLLQMLNALSYIHGKNIIHRDIKPQNIFLDSNAIIKIGDFGISKILESTIHTVSTAGSYCYMSPEMIECKKYNNKTDVWSLGCVMWELACLQRPFADKAIAGIMKKISEQPAGDIPGFYSDLLQVVINKMLIKDQNSRPSVDKFLMDGKILQVMTVITKSSHLKQSQLKSELTLQVNPDQKKFEQKNKKKVKKENDLQNSFQKDKVLYLIESAKKQVETKLQKMASEGVKKKQIQEYEFKIKKAFQELTEKIDKGFQNLRNQKYQSSGSQNPFNGSSSLSSETIKSVMVGENTMKKIQLESEKKLQTSELEDDDLEYSKSQYDQIIGSTIKSKNADFNGMTIRSNNSSVLGSTIKSQSFNGTLKQTIKEGLRNQFDETIKSQYENTISCKQLGNTLFSKYQASFSTSNNPKAIDNQLQVLQLLGREIEYRPSILMDETALQYTISNADTLNFTLLSKEQVSIRSQPTFQEVPIQQCIEIEDDYNFQKNTKSENEFEKSFNKKNSSSKSYNSIDRDKQMKDIIEMYKAQLQKTSSDQNKKYLILSEIKEQVNDYSTMTKNDSKSMKNSATDKR